MKKAESTLKKHKRILLIVLGATLLLLLVCACVWLYYVLARPESLFEPSVVLPDTQPEPVASSEIAVVLEPTLSPGPEPEPDITEGHIVNILLLGMDLEYKEYATDGGDYHTDAMIVVAVNFDEDTVDLISLSRDTFSRFPGVRGFYKLNAAINCGGGKTERGFDACRSAASWLLGGISVDYYFALDMEAVARIGDAIGGVDFNVDMSYTGVYGQYYKKGMQHLDGRGIYDYMRARMNATKNATDDGRMNRQKQMLLAMFEKMQQQEMLSTVPSILQTVSDLSFTNLNPQQILALANYAYRIDAESVGMYTMTGARYRVMNYVYTFPDQDKRVKMIRDVYGVDVDAITNCTYEVAKWLQDTGLYALRCINIADQLYQDYMDSAVDKEQSDALAALQTALEQSGTAFEAAESGRTRALNAALNEAVSALKTAAADAKSAFGDADEIDWDYKRIWYKDTNINEVMVDFR